jgi:hypothetical protein
MTTYIMNLPAGTYFLQARVCVLADRALNKQLTCSEWSQQFSYSQNFRADLDLAAQMIRYDETNTEFRRLGAELIKAAEQFVQEAQRCDKKDEDYLARLRSFVAWGPDLAADRLARLVPGKESKGLFLTAGGPGEGAAAAAAASGPSPAELEAQIAGLRQEAEPLLASVKGFIATKQLRGLDDVPLESKTAAEMMRDAMRKPLVEHLAVDANITDGIHLDRAVYLSSAVEIEGKVAALSLGNLTLDRLAAIDEVIIAIDGSLPKLTYENWYEYGGIFERYWENSREYKLLEKLASLRSSLVEIKVVYPDLVALYEKNRDIEMKSMAVNSLRQQAAELEAQKLRQQIDVAPPPRAAVDVEAAQEAVRLLPDAVERGTLQAEVQLNQVEAGVPEARLNPPPLREIAMGNEVPIISVPAPSQVEVVRVHHEGKRPVAVTERNNDIRSVLLASMGDPTPPHIAEIIAEVRKRRAPAPPPPRAPASAKRKLAPAHSQRTATNINARPANADSPPPRQQVPVTPPKSSIVAIPAPVKAEVLPDAVAKKNSPPVINDAAPSSWKSPLIAAAVFTTIIAGATAGSYYAHEESLKLSADCYETAKSRFAASLQNTLSAAKNLQSQQRALLSHLSRELVRSP